MLTYNHGQYIEQAIHSVLNQALPDGIELSLIVGDDASPDNTADHVARLAGLHPARITAVLRPNNIGMFANYSDLWRRADGDYIAVLEGDDYWTDPGKLRAQFTAMEQHPDWAMSFHRVKWIDGSGKDLGPVVPWPHWFREGTDAKALTIRNFVSTPSVMYRQGVVPDLPAWLAPLRLLDWPIHLLHAALGDVGFVDIIGAAYRVHGGGVWSLQPSLERHAAVMEMAEAFVTHADSPALKDIARHLRSEAQQAHAKELHRAGELRAARRLFIASLRDDPVDPARLQRRVRAAVRLFAPGVFTRRWLEQNRSEWD
jgi:hypothetical protein